MIPIQASHSGRLSPREHKVFTAVFGMAGNDTPQAGSRKKSDGRHRANPKNGAPSRGKRRRIPAVPNNFITAAGNLGAM
jgi:hypothetical protein